jgi:hypothetical protein
MWNPWYVTRNDKIRLRSWYWVATWVEKSSRRRKEKYNWLKLIILTSTEGDRGVKIKTWGRFKN